MAYVRRNQASLSAAEWTALIGAIDATHGMGIPAPRYRDFVRVHVAAMDMLNPVGMSWGVHSMGPMMVGRNFLAWHRLYLLRLEARLRFVDPTVSIPYWDWMGDRRIPSRLASASLLASWGVTRAWDRRQLPIPPVLAGVNAQTSFTPFQRMLEFVHGGVHVAVGGTMAGSSSPADPLFWLHHANIDRLWALWQAAHPGARPPNGSELLEPSFLLGRRVSSVLKIAALGYGYA